MSKKTSRGCLSSAADALGRLSLYISQSDRYEPSNEAAYLEEAKTRPLVVRSAPYVLPRKGQVLIKNAAVAVNPIDWKVQDYDVFKSTYPLVLGSDAAGEVVAVGEGVTGFEVGQRVFAHTGSAGAQDNAQGGFQQYSIARSTVTTAIPISLPFEHAVVLGLGVATAAAGLYQKDFLALKLPSVSKTVKPTKEKKVVIVWGGSSSVGSCAIQLARHSGYDVFAVAGRANLDYITELGAVRAFSYRDDNIVHEILASLNDRKLAGTYDAIGSPTTISTLAQIVSESNGSKFIAHTSPGVKVPDLPHGVTIRGVNASTVARNEIGPAVFNDFLPRALEEGQFLAKPDPKVVGHGLEYVQKGLDMVKGGVSATKVVISL